MRKPLTASLQLEGSLRQFFYCGGVILRWPAEVFVNIFKAHEQVL